MAGVFAGEYVTCVATALGVMCGIRQTCQWARQAGCFVCVLNRHTCHPTLVWPQASQALNPRRSAEPPTER
eukprot:308613-Chlamydomonas_euryale.AAC.1